MKIFPEPVLHHIYISKGHDYWGKQGEGRMQNGIIECEGSQECTPCHWMDRVISEGSEEFMKSDFRGGLRAKILTDGMLRRD